MQTHHRIDYVELPVRDLEAAKRFYGDAFGWAFEDYGSDYAAFKNAGLDGGLRPDPTPPGEGGALVILYSDDLEASEAAVTKAGAEITERHDFPGGRRIHFRDPAGNVLALWTKA